MHNGKPVGNMRKTAIQPYSVGLRACGLLMLGALWLASLAMAAPGPKSATGQDKQQAAASEFVGSETCATCHEEVAKGFANNPHTKMVQMHGSNGVTCENCHGAGKAHVDGGGDISKIFNPAKAPAKRSRSEMPDLSCRDASEFRAFAPCQGRGKLHLVSRSSPVQAGRVAAEGASAHALFPVPRRSEGAVQHGLPSQGE